MSGGRFAGVPPGVGDISGVVGCEGMLRDVYVLREGMRARVADVTLVHPKPALMVGVGEVAKVDRIIELEAHA